MDKIEEFNLNEVLNNIKFAISEVNVTNLRDFLDVIDDKILQKDIIELAINSGDCSIIDLVLEKAAPESMDREIISKAIKTEDKEIIKLVADNIGDKVVFLENRERLQNAILGEEDIKSIAGQILSVSENDSVDCEMQEILLEMYLDVVKKYFNKGDLPKNFPMNQFSESILESIFFIAAPERINFESLNEKRRFLLLPVYTKGHAFCAYVRKQEEDKYSITFINLDVSSKQSAKGINSYEEYIYTKKRALDILDIFSFSARNYFLSKTVDTEFAYSTFKYLSMEKYNINVVSRNQKLGNCFIKNMEKGLRYALAIELSKAIDENFETSSLRIDNKTKDINEKYRVKFLEPFFKAGNRRNNFTTLQLKEELVKSLTNKFFKYKNEINSEWSVYKSKKENNSSEIQTKGRKSNIIEIS
jgi:hypothetical protein